MPKSPGDLTKTRPDRVVESRTEQTHDRGVNSAHHSLRGRALAKAVPERQRAEKNQNAEKECQRVRAPRGLISQSKRRGGL
jgi:hypothetical protein